MGVNPMTSKLAVRVAIASLRSALLDALDLLEFQLDRSRAAKN